MNFPFMRYYVVPSATWPRLDWLARVHNWAYLRFWRLLALWFGLMVATICLAWLGAGLNALWPVAVAIISIMLLYFVPGLTLYHAEDQSKGRILSFRFGSKLADFAEGWQQYINRLDKHDRLFEAGWRWEVMRDLPGMRTGLQDGTMRHHSARWIPMRATT